jgi:ribose-phosphate pyrophosphokinase
VEQYRDHVPVLIDDIISTAGTMIKTTKQLLQLNMKPPVCIGIHAVFAGNAYEALKMAGAGEIVTTNTIAHPSSRIDLSHQLSILL